MAHELDEPNETTSLLPRAPSSRLFFPTLITQQRRRAVFSGGLLLSLIGTIVSVAGYSINKDRYTDRNRLEIVEPWLFPLILFVPSILVFFVLLIREFLKGNTPLPALSDLEDSEINLPKNGCFGW